MLEDRVSGSPLCRTGDLGIAAWSLAVRDHHVQPMPSAEAKERTALSGGVAGGIVAAQHANTVADGSDDRVVSRLVQIVRSPFDQGVIRR